MPAGQGQLGGAFDPTKPIDLVSDVNTTGAVLSSGTAGIGYSTGAGGVVTQLTNKSTGVTLNKLCGAITMNNAALSNGVEVSFTVTNSLVGLGDVPVVCHSSAGTAGSYQVTVSAVAAGSFAVTVSNCSAGSLSEAIVVSFFILKGVTA